MMQLRCRDHGFTCNFEVEGDDVSMIIERFGNHVSLEHGIKFEKETLMQLMLGDLCSCPYCNSRFESKQVLSKHVDRIHHGSGILEGNVRDI